MKLGNKTIELLQFTIIVLIGGLIVGYFLLQLHDIRFCFDHLVLGIPHILVELYVLLDCLNSFTYRKAVLADKLESVSYETIFTLVKALDVTQDMIVVQQGVGVLHSY